MIISPVLPLNIHGKIDQNLLCKAEKVCIDSAKLASGHTEQLVNSLRDVLRITNSFYSNRIEAQSTHPIEIEKAMKREFSDDIQAKKLQELSIAHIHAQHFVEKCVLEGQNVIDREFIKMIHQSFYGYEGMEDFKIIEFNGKFITMVSGEFRDRLVEVGKHVAPAHDSLGAIFNYFEKEYSSIFAENTKAVKLLAALSAHHRLTYIHPFLDGNGRVSRLYFDAMAFYMNLEGYGLWNISRGLARDVKEYQSHLTYADMLKQGATDGKGELSLRGLCGYLDYMLDVALDQIDFMGQSLKMSTINERIKKFVAFSQNGMYSIAPLPKYSDTLFSELLLCGEMERGQVQKILGKSQTTSFNLVKDLLAMDFIQSDTPRGKIRLKLNSFFASKIIPDLIPDA